jgi:sporulation integral membrane protein YtvI
MLDKMFLIRLKKIGIFVVIFTVLFILFFLTLKFTLPFVLGFTIALSTKSFNQFLQKKLKMSAGLSSIITTTIVFSILGVIVTLAIYKATSETVLLLSKMPNIDSISKYIDMLIKEITEIIGQIDPFVVQKLYEYLNTILTQLLSISIRVLNTLLSYIISLPAVLLIAVITFLATYLFSKDLRQFSNKFYGVFSKEGETKMRSIVESSIAMTIGYAKAYLLLVFITFVIVFIGFLLLDIDFALILGFLCAVLDILPVVGMIIIFIPLIIYHLFAGNTLTAILLAVLFLFIQVARQAIQPKVLSQTLDIHPLLILAAIFIGVSVSGVLGMIYFIALLVAYKVLEKVNVI